MIVFALILMQCGVGRIASASPARTLGCVLYIYFFAEATSLARKTQYFSFDISSLALTNVASAAKLKARLFIKRASSR